MTKQKGKQLLPSIQYDFRMILGCLWSSKMSGRESQIVRLCPQVETDMFIQMNQNNIICNKVQPGVSFADLT